MLITTSNFHGAGSCCASTESTALASRCGRRSVGITTETICMELCRVIGQTAVAKKDPHLTDEAPVEEQGHRPANAKETNPPDGQTHRERRIGQGPLKRQRPLPSGYRDPAT